MSSAIQIISLPELRGLHIISSNNPNPCIKACFDSKENMMSAFKTLNQTYREWLVFDPVAGQPSSLGIRLCIQKQKEGAGLAKIVEIMKAAFGSKVEQFIQAQTQRELVERETLAILNSKLSLDQIVEALNVKFGEETVSNYFQRSGSQQSEGHADAVLPRMPTPTASLWDDRLGLDELNLTENVQSQKGDKSALDRSEQKGHV